MRELAKPREYRGFTIDKGHSGSIALPVAAWARDDEGHCLKALGQFNLDVDEKIDREIDRFWHEHSSQEP